MIIFVYTVTLLAILSTLYIERKKPGEALAWVLIFIIFPIGGVIIYLVFGSTFRFKLRRLRLKNRYPEEYEKLQEFHPSDSREKMTDLYPEVLQFNRNYSGSSFTTNNSARVITGGEEKFDALFQDIKNAKEHVHLLYFGIKNDEVGRKLVKLLSRRAKEGIEIRVLYDRMGSLFTPRRFFRELISAGGRVVSIRPFLLDVNYRNHRKIAVIDGQIGYTGGMNIGGKYLGQHHRRRPWRDTHLRLKGEVVHNLQFIFLNDWVVARRKTEQGIFSRLAYYFPQPGDNGETGIQVVASGADDDQNIKMSYLRMIGSAREKIWLQTPYLVPDETIFNGLLVAAASGLDVRIMLPSIPGNRFLKHATNHNISRLLEYGVRIFYYQGYIHAKTMIIDGLVCCIGSVNIDVRSLEISDEIFIYFHDPAFTRRYDKIYREDLASSREMDYEKFKERGTGARFWEGIFSFFSPLF